MDNTTNKHEFACNAGKVTEYEVKEHIDTIMVGFRGFSKEVSIVKWNDKKPVFDIRAWRVSDRDGLQYPLRGITFSKEMLFFAVAMQKSMMGRFSYGKKLRSSQSEDFTMHLPVTDDGAIDFDFMESFIAELEAERVAELSAYLTVSGLDNYELSSEEESVLKNFQSLKWDTYNLEKLFGKATRGKRLKGDDRIAGTLPFVTAGEASEGISAYISNEVEVFEKNTTTIDMFGSAKYRNYKYGADDHVAVVHTEAVPMKAAIFVTSACHKAAHTGKFDYGHMITVHRLKISCK